MKFKVGDKVRVINEEEEFPTLVGLTGEITEVDADDIWGFPYSVYLDKENDHYWFSEEDIELV